MTNHVFRSVLFDTRDEWLRAIAAAYLRAEGMSDGGIGDQPIHELFDEYTDQQLAEELTRDWPPQDEDEAKAMDRPKPYTPAEMAAVFAELRKDQS